MNPEHLDTYIGGLQKTLEEKLFFVDVLGKDFFSNKIIIDFGCGDGSIIDYIVKHCNCENSLFIGVDINEEMLKIATEKVTVGCAQSFFCKTLDDFSVEKDHLPIVFIASSVLHELDEKQKNQIWNFMNSKADFIIIRDMYVPEPCFIDAPNKDLLSKIILGANTRMLSQFVKKYGADDYELIHFLLKYTYVENWETEIEEDYLSAPWDLIHHLFAYHDSRFKVVYDKDYIQKWRADRVKKDFGIKLSDYTSSTHRQVILKRKIPPIEEGI